MLCIGGPADGERVDHDPKLSMFRYPINPLPPAFTPDEAAMQYHEVHMLYAEYRVEYIGLGNNQRIFFAVYTELSTEQAIEMLFQKYPRKAAIRNDYL